MKTAADLENKLEEKPVRRPLPESVRQEIAALAEMSGEDIDYSDIPATTHEYWEGAVRGRFYRPDTQYKYPKD